MHYKLKKFLKLSFWNLLIIIGIVLSVVFPIMIVNCIRGPFDPHQSIKNGFGVSIPREWNNIYYNAGSLGGFDGRGSDYHVYSVTDCEDKFFEGFSGESDQEFETEIEECLRRSFEKHHPIESEYLFDLSEEYLWKIVCQRKDSRLQYAYFILQSHRLYAVTWY